jgi:hypothetical protein
LLFVDKETNGSYPFANGINGPAHLWVLVNTRLMDVCCQIY